MKRQFFIYWTCLLSASGGIVVSPEIVDFGFVSENQRPVLTMSLDNTGTNSVRITEFIRTCVCSDASIDKSVIEPGGSAVVTFPYDPNVLGAGPFRKTFFVKTDDPAQPSIALTLKGENKYLWKVVPGSEIALGHSAGSAVFTITPSADAPAIELVEVSGGVGGAVATLATNAVGSALSLSFSPPDEAAAGHHSWSIRLMPAGAAARPLTLEVSREYGTAWVTTPRMIQMPKKTDGPFVASFSLKPLGFDASALNDVDFAAIEITPKWDGVVFEAVSKSMRGGIVCKLSIPPEMINNWELSKTFNFTINGSGSASLYLER